MRSSIRVLQLTEAHLDHLETTAAPTVDTPDPNPILRGRRQHVGSGERLLQVMSVLQVRELSASTTFDIADLS
jgi:hypothetical protein